MKEAHALFCGGWSIKESQVFISTLQHLLTAATKTDDEPDAAKTTRCWATPQRWLLTLDTPSLRAALWNPSTKEKVELPSMEKDLPRNCKCLLSREPGSRAGCVVVVVVDDEPVIWFCRVGGERWSRHEYEIIVEKPRGSPNFRLVKKQSFEEAGCATNLISPDEETRTEYILEGHSWKRIRIPSDGHGSHRFQIRSIAAVDGKFYFDVSPSKLGVLDFLPGPTFTMMDTKGARVAWDSWELAFPHLAESRGRLYLFVIAHNSLASIALYKMDFSSLAWSKVDRVYDQVFFLGRLHFSASYSAWELGLTQCNVYYL
uniref:KIB1-4 beta-propeller domain-containing protein n=1 Tax=Triticum urartu TaxID=4572 RepID=A0A8R7Q1Q7_TRIUA